MEDNKRNQPGQGQGQGQGQQDRGQSQQQGQGSLGKSTQGDSSTERTANKQQGNQQGHKNS